jgi:hypothetical protein
MASRCTKTTNLEVHHMNKYGLNTLSNAKVLCHSCHVNTHTYGDPGHSATPFPQSVKDEAIKNAGNRCQCERDYCH